MGGLASGRIPKPAGQVRRRNALPGSVHLPAEGRRGDPPAWPLGPVLDGEHAAWADAWATPQAVAWERMGTGANRVVARYVRLRCAVEYAGAEAPVTLLAEVRQLEDRLGLTPVSMLRLRWEIVPDELAEARAEEAPAAPVRRIRAVE